MQNISTVDIGGVEHLHTPVQENCGSLQNYALVETIHNMGNQERAALAPKKTRYWFGDTFVDPLS